MTTDELKALLAETTPGPWEAVLDVFWRVYVADGGDYAGQCVGDMNESAAMWRSPSDEQPDDFAEANARLIALAPVLAAEVIALREREARLVEALRWMGAERNKQMRTADYHGDGEVADGIECPECEGAGTVECECRDEPDDDYLYERERDRRMEKTDE